MKVFYIQCGHGAVMTSGHGPDFLVARLGDLVGAEVFFESARSTDCDPFCKDFRVAELHKLQTANRVGMVGECLQMQWEYPWFSAFGMFL